MLRIETPMSKSRVSPWLQQRVQRYFVPKAEQKSTYQVSSERRYKAAVRVALSKGYLKTLDEQLILELQRSSEDDNAALEVHEVQRIDLRYGGVQALDHVSLLACHKLRVCNLRGCYVSDIVAFYRCKNLLKLDLADNQISHLPSSDFWSSLSSLKVLYLSGNVLSMTEDLVRLGRCQSLLVLTLYDTPLALSLNYRHQVVNSIFSLKALDRHVISDDEVITNLRVPVIFKAKGDNMKLHLYSLKKQGISVKEEVRQVFTLLLAVDQVLARFSPVIILQRYIRGWLVRRCLLRGVAGNLIRTFIQKKDGSILRTRDARTSSDQTSLHTSIINTTCSTILPFLPPHRPHHESYPLPPHRPHYKSYPLPPPSSPNFTRPHSHTHPPHDSLVTTVGIDLASKLRSIEEHAKADQWDPVEIGSDTLMLGMSERGRTMEDWWGREQKEVQQVVAAGVLMKWQGQREVTQEGQLEDDVIIKGQPACIIEDSQYSCLKKDNENLSKQHKEFKEVARAARSKSSKEDTYSTIREGKKYANNLLYRRVYTTLSLQPLEDVDKYYREGKSRREQEKRNHHVVQQWCERKERSQKVEEHLAKRREKIVEDGWDDHNLMACHAEDTENEQKFLHYQTTHRRHQSHMQSERMKERMDISKRTAQKFTMLNNYLRNEEVRAHKADKLAIYLATASQRHAEWENEKEQRRKADENHQIKLLAQPRLDKEILNARLMQKKADSVMESRTPVLKERARCAGHSKAMEEAKLDFLCKYDPTAMQRPNSISIVYMETPEAQVPRAATT